MKIEKINNKDFVRQIAKDTGYAQKDISAVLNSAADITLQNLNNGKATAVLKGMVVYPSHYNEVQFPRARFGKSFKMNAPLS